MAEVLARLLDVQVFATTQLAAGSGLGKRVVISTVDAMARVKRVESATMEGEPAGWRLTRDETVRRRRCHKRLGDRPCPASAGPSRTPNSTN